MLTQPDTEIATCITEIGLPFTLDDLRSPKPAHIQKVFEHFANILMNSTREIVAPAMKAAAEDLLATSSSVNLSCVDVERLYCADVRDLMGFFVIMRRLLSECNIEDFGFNDLYRPTHARMQKILSYIINFVRFRESQTAVIDQHFEEGERTKLRVQQLYAEKEVMEQRLLTLRNSAKETEKRNAEKEQHYEKLKTQLRELVRTKDTLRLETDNLESQKEQLIQTFEQRALALEAGRDEASKLKPYAQQKPDALETQVRDLNARLAEDKATIEALDRRARALQTSSDSFSAAAQDVQTCLRLLTDLSTDLQKEDEELHKAAKHREALSDRVAGVEDVERQERLLQKQLDNIISRTEKLRRSAEEKSETAQQRMDELQDVHRKLVKERGEKAREVERRRVRIEQTEKKVCSIHDFLITSHTDSDFRCKISRRILRMKYMRRGRNTSRWRVISSCTLMRWNSALLEDFDVRWLFHSWKWVGTDECVTELLHLIIFADSLGNHMVSGMIWGYP